jgi:RNase P subunit RPR2
MTATRGRLSLIQRLVTRLVPGRAAEIERHSREWIITCPHCGHERSYWDIGGVRYKARSRGKRLGMRCPSCGRRGWHPVQHRPGGGSPNP